MRNATANLTTSLVYLKNNQRRRLGLVSQVSPASEPRSVNGRQRVARTATFITPRGVYVEAKQRGWLVDGDVAWGEWSQI